MTGFPQAARDHSSLFRVLHQATVVSFVVLLATGVFLFFFYQPSAAAAWGVLYDTTDTGSISQTAQIIHRWSGFLLVPLSLATAIAGLTKGGMAAGPRLGVLALPVLTGVALFTGLLLPWEQVALWAVRVGTDVRGYLIVSDDQIKFFLGDQGVVGPGTMIWYLATHVTVSLVFAGALVLTRNRTT